MIIISEIFTAEWLAALNCLAGVGFVFALLKAPWRALFAVPARQHLLFGAIVMTAFLWLINVRVLDLFRLHPMVLTTLTLLLGWPLATMAGSLAQVILAIVGVGSWTTLGADIVLTTLIPASGTYALLHLSRRSGIKNLFVYLLGVGFLGGVLSVLLVAATTVTLLSFSGQNGLVDNALQDAPLIVMLMFPEGFINGTLVTAMTVYFPHWMKTFDEDFYLD